MNGPNTFHPQGFSSHSDSNNSTISNNSSAISNHNNSLFGQNRYHDGERQEIAQLLNRQLGPEYVSIRSGHGGSRVHYLEGNKAIELANKVFGFNGWSSSVVGFHTDYMEDTSGNGTRWNIGLSCTVRVTLKDGAFHEDVGYGMIDNARHRGNGLEKCKKEAVTDALKRSLRLFGNALGNCMYDKSFTTNIQRVQKDNASKTINVDNLMRFDTSREVFGSASATPLESPKATVGHPQPQQHGDPVKTVDLTRQQQQSGDGGKTSPPVEESFDTSMDALMMNMPMQVQQQPSHSHLHSASSASEMTLLNSSSSGGGSGTGAMQNGTNGAVLSEAKTTNFGATAAHVQGKKPWPPPTGPANVRPEMSPLHGPTSTTSTATAPFRPSIASPFSQGTNPPATYMRPPVPNSAPAATTTTMSTHYRPPPPTTANPGNAPRPAMNSGGPPSTLSKFPLPNTSQPMGGYRPSPPPPPQQPQPQLYQQPQQQPYAAVATGTMHRPPGGGHSNNTFGAPSGAGVRPFAGSGVGVGKENHPSMGQVRPVTLANQNAPDLKRMRTN